MPDPSGGKGQRNRTEAPSEGALGPTTGQEGGLPPEGKSRAEPGVRKKALTTGPRVGSKDSCPPHGPLAQPGRAADS